MLYCRDGMSTRSSVYEGLQSERGVRRSLQEEKIVFLLVQNKSTTVGERLVLHAVTVYRRPIRLPASQR